MQFVRTNFEPSWIERSTWLSAAKWTTASWPSIASRDVVGLADVGMDEVAARVVEDVADALEVAGVGQRVVDR